MKKVFTILFCLIISINGVFADGEQFYQYYDNLDVKFISAPLNKDSFYKKILKNENYMNKGKYNKAEKLLPDFIPNIARFINVYSDNKDFHRALEYAKKLEELDKSNLFPKYAKDYRIGILYSQTGDYLHSNSYLYPYVKTNSMAAFQIAQNYYYMQDLKTAETYAEKISADSGAYFSAQELLYTINSVTKNPQKAYRAARNLIKLDAGNPENYIKIATVTTNNAEKLINYYRAKQIYTSQNLLNMVAKVNTMIAPLEQSKIDAAYKKITTYCKKPDWFKIKEKYADLLANDTVYWDSRQSEFFDAANDCINKYKDSNLAACFNDLNNTQDKLNIALVEENSRRIEAAQRAEQIRQLVRQNMLLEEQNMIQWSRYNNYYYPRYYRPPYWW